MSRHVLPTDANLYVVAVRGVFQVVYGAHHVQGHVADVVSMVLCLLWSPGYHHVGISNGLDLEGDGEEQLLHCGHLWIKCIRAGGGGGMHSNLEDAVLLAERVEQRIHGVEHGDHLHRSDVAANASKSHHVAEEDGHIWEHLEDRDKKVNERQRERERETREGGARGTYLCLCFYESKIPHSPPDIYCSKKSERDVDQKTGLSVYVSSPLSE